jgi:hypothetical protein
LAGPVSPLDHAWTGLVDDAAIFPPGDSPLPDAVAAHVARREEWYADLVGSFVVTDVRVPEVDRQLVLSVVVSGGAGAIPGALRLVAKREHDLAGVEIALRDLDDLPGNARRVAAAVDDARSEGLLAEDVPTYVEVPPGPEPAWLAAADVVAEAGLRLKFRTGGLAADLFPAAPVLAGWIDAALDRETPFKCTAGLHRAVAHTADDGFPHHGFLNVLLATLRAFDGATREEAVALLEQGDAGALVAAAAGEDLARGRRWFTSFGSCSVSEPLTDLLALGLLEKP